MAELVEKKRNTTDHDFPPHSQINLWGRKLASVPHARLDGFYGLIQALVGCRQQQLTLAVYLAHEVRLVQVCMEALQSETNP